MNKQHKRCDQCIDIGWVNALMQLQDWIRQNNKHSAQVDRIIGKCVEMVEEVSA